MTLLKKPFYGDYDRDALERRCVALDMALQRVRNSENGKLAKGTALECDCPGCLAKNRIARAALGERDGK